MALGKLRRSLVLAVVAWGAVGCDDTTDAPSETSAKADVASPTIRIERPEVVVMADDVDIAVRVDGAPVDAVRYSVSIKSAASGGGTVASGVLKSTDGQSYAGRVTLDAEGIYQLRVVGTRNGREDTEEYQDFKYSFVAPPEPRFPEIEGRRSEVKLSRLEDGYRLVVDTAPGIRVEVSRGQELLGRATAVTDRLELHLDLDEGENALTVRSWRRQASLEKTLTLDVVIDDAAPQPERPVTVDALCRAGRTAAAWGARGRLDERTADTLAPCLLLGAVKAEAWAGAAALIDRPSDTLAQWPLDALLAGAMASARQGAAGVRDRAWRLAVERIAESERPLIDRKRAEQLGRTMRESGAEDSVLLPCVEHDDRRHVCHRLLSGAGAAQPKVDPVAPPEDPIGKTPPDVPPDPPTTPDAAVDDAAGDGPELEIRSACRSNRFRDAAAAYQGAQDPTVTDAERLCIALGLQMSGRCEDALSMADPLTGSRASDAVPAWQLIGGCHATLGRKDEAARSWQRAIELALSGRSRFRMSPARVRADLERARLDEAQYARAVEPCSRHAGHTLCAALIDEVAPSASLAELCRNGDHGAAAAHPDAESPPERLALCVARGLVELGQPGRARTVLRAAVRKMSAGGELGAASRLLAEVSTGRDAVEAMKRAVEMVAQSLYVVEDPPQFYREITAVRGRDAVEQIITPCRQASRREACRKLLSHFDGEPAQPEPAQPEPEPAQPEPEPAQPEPEPTQPEPARPEPVPAPALTASKADVIGRPAGARLVLILDDGTKIEKATPSGAFDIDEDALPVGAVRFSMSAGGRQTRSGRVNLRARKAAEGPVRLYAHKVGAHKPYSDGEAALARGDTGAAIAAFRAATRADSDFCLAYTYLGYAQGLAGDVKQAKGSLQRCSSSLDNDLAAVATARFMSAVVELRNRIDSASPEQLASLLRGLRRGYGRVVYANRVLRGTARGRSINLGVINSVWTARGKTAYWRKLAAAEGAPEPIASACREALKVWRKLPASQMRYVGTRLTDTKADFADERTRAMAELGAACK